MVVLFSYTPVQPKQGTQIDFSSSYKKHKLAHKLTMKIVCNFFFFDSFKTGQDIRIVEICRLADTLGSIVGVVWRWTLSGRDISHRDDP